VVWSLLVFLFARRLELLLILDTDSFSFGVDIDGRLATFAANARLFHASKRDSVVQYSENTTITTQQHNNNKDGE